LKIVVISLLPLSEGWQTNVKNSPKTLSTYWTTGFLVTQPPSSCHSGR